MKRIKQAEKAAQQGRGGTREVRLKQAINSGVVQLEEPKVEMSPVGYVERDDRGQLKIGSNRPASNL